MRGMNGGWASIGAGLLAVAMVHSPRLGATEPLASAPVRVEASLRSGVFDGTVEAVRQTVIGAQVAGAVVDLEVRAGDVVKAGQTLLRLDARAAQESLAASEAQIDATRANLNLARQELARQRQLFDRAYISQAALERAQAQVDATQAQLEVQRAQASAVRTQTGFHRVVSPYAGVVSEVPVALGDLALPGRPLLTLYDPTALRVTVAVPQTALAPDLNAGAIRIELALAGQAARSVTPVRLTRLPVVDASTRTVSLRLDLPFDLSGRETGVAPGAFARVVLPGVNGVGASRAERMFIPQQAVVRRAELAAVYLLNERGEPVLRQVRLGPASGMEVEVLAGLRVGERVALDPQAAARVR